LMLYENGASAPASLFHTIHSFDVLWSGDSRYVAITHAIGENRSEVITLDLSTGSRSGPFDLTPAIESYFPELYLAAPQFMRAYCWSNAGLLIRGIGRTPTAPYDEFGYEVLLNLDATDPRLRITFLRGFIKHARQP
jgi:hypothetical protein